MCVCTPQRYSPLVAEGEGDVALLVVVLLVVVVVVGLVEEEALWAPE